MRWTLKYIVVSFHLSSLLISFRKPPWTKEICSLYQVNFFICFVACECVQCKSPYSTDLNSSINQGTLSFAYLYIITAK